jgi:hypothetical protein
MIGLHRRTADLLAAERFGYLAELRRAEYANVGGEFRKRCADPSQCRQQQIIEFARICLGRDFAGGQTKTFQHVRFELRRTARAAGELFVGRGGTDRTAQSLGREIFECELQCIAVDRQILRVHG